jgi:hypothetical protein
VENGRLLDSRGWYTCHRGPSFPESRLSR